MSQARCPQMDGWMDGWMDAWLDDQRDNQSGKRNEHLPGLKHSYSLFVGRWSAGDCLQSALRTSFLSIYDARMCA
ncbi:uncharacterized protein BO72DRAFT_157997 [Aspergillus fijiensis CBS 313.89]|uniref:Uncharacterized protein n=1 Tax=Aspergillus fijiensis CBS 313.89 TaxID=1448319 RepID=A0A8G1RN54_9EURO|nr:uncharacterized protein BO72DRAFT_157997 [Aspergillus fijiensis CBS 313.89]RAK75718.1 hypothetical protein BO72DRAFT_157997 [Aspergillus fijiensis CBS 313.89]